MKIILSPSKTQKIKKIEGFKLKDITYAKETDELINILKSLSGKDIKRIMKTSDKLTEEILDSYDFVEALAALRQASTAHSSNKEDPAHE